MRPITLATAVLVVSTALSACSTESEEKAARSSAEGNASSTTSLVVSDVWVRATSGTDDPSMTAAFMSLENDGAQTTLVGAHADVADSAEIHEMVMGDEGAMVMQRKEGGMELATGAHEHLEPGGDHIMLMDLTEELQPGDEISLTLEFADGSEQEVTAPVKEFTEEEGSYQHSHESPSPSASQ